MGSDEMDDVAGFGTAAELAATLGIDSDLFLDVFGAGWEPFVTEVARDVDADPAGGEGGPWAPWHIAGEPPQLMIQVLDHGVLLARPEGIWASGTHDLRYRPVRQQYVARHELEANGRGAVRRLLKARRSSFRYCSFCRRVTPPESLLDGACHGCASHRWGVVH